MSADDNSAHAHNTRLLQGKPNDRRCAALKRTDLKENAPRSSNLTRVLTSGDVLKESDDRAKQNLLTLLSSFSLPEIQFWNQYLADAN